MKSLTPFLVIVALLIKKKIIVVKGKEKFFRVLSYNARQMPTRGTGQRVLA